MGNSNLPRVAILGRPNVGKSTLYNRIAGKRLAIVEDTPGVTRDWQEILVDFWGLSFMLVDTPGLEKKADDLGENIWDHTFKALSHADIYIFVMDGRQGILPDDEMLARWVRKTGKPVVLAVNKSEGYKGDMGTWDAWKLGLGEPIPISAAHGQGMSDIAACLEEKCPALSLQENTNDPYNSDLSEQEDFEKRPLKIGIVGRPNVGKSTLINYCLRQDRMLTGEQAGLTRDSIELPWEFDKRSVILVDTAGLRKAYKIDDALEKIAVSDTFQTIQYAQVVVVVMDATQAFERQDCVIAARVAEEGRALVLALNKWDQIPDPIKWMEELQYRASVNLPQVKGVPLVPMSALHKQGIKSLMKQVFKSEEKWRTRVPTSALNRALEKIITDHQPPFQKGRRIKLKYMSQVKAAPPTFALFGTQTKDLPLSYQNYLINSLREIFDLQGVPLRLILKNTHNPFHDKKP